MRSFSYTIQDPVGLHARPAGMLVKAAKEFASRIILSANGKTADAKKLMQLMSAGITKGTQVTVTAEGEDEQEAVAGMKQFFETNL